MKLNTQIEGFYASGQHICDMLGIEIPWIIKIEAHDDVAGLELTIIACTFNKYFNEFINHGD